MPHYPAPDRSNHRPNRTKTDDNPQLDIGWTEGTLSDGRPFRLECWCADQMTCLTFFFSRLGMEELTREAAVELLEREELLVFLTDFRSAYPVAIEDAAGRPMWSVNVVLGADEDDAMVWYGLGLEPYH